MDLIERLNLRLFGEPLVMNVLRGELVEEICLMALEPEWCHVGGDYGHCDLVHPRTGLEVQVKQSAALQTWGLSKTAPRFSIAYKAGKWIDGNEWQEGRSRNADIFTFAWHPLTDQAADHRNPEQWEFYLVAERALPQQDTISLGAIKKLAEQTRYAGLGDRAAFMVSKLESYRDAQATTTKRGKVQ